MIKLSNGHGGRKIKINFNSDRNGEVLFSIKEIAYPHSSRSKKYSGSGVWTLWEQERFHRPAQAFQELFFALRDLKLINNAEGLVVAKEYWERGLIKTRDERVKEIEEYKKFFD